MQQVGERAEEVAAALHPDISADDVTRYLAGEPAIDEERRGLNVDALMAQFADSIEEVEQEHSNDLT